MQLGKECLVRKTWLGEAGRTWVAWEEVWQTWEEDYHGDEVVEGYGLVEEMNEALNCPQVRQWDGCAWGERWAGCILNFSLALECTGTGHE